MEKRGEKNFIVLAGKVNILGKSVLGNHNVKSIPICFSYIWAKMWSSSLHPICYSMEYKMQHGFSETLFSKKVKPLSYKNEKKNVFV